MDFKFLFNQFVPIFILNHLHKILIILVIPFHPVQLVFSIFQCLQNKLKSFRMMNLESLF